MDVAYYIQHPISYQVNFPHFHWYKYLAAELPTGVLMFDLFRDLTALLVERLPAFLA